CHARMFWVGKIGKEFEIGWDGRVPSLEELGRLFPSVLSGDARLSELAIALSSASRLFSKIELRISHGLLLLDNGKLTLLSREQKSSWGLEISLKGRSGLKFLPLFKNLKQLSILAKRCSHAPLAWNLPMGVNAPRSKLKGELVRFGMMGDARGETLYYRHTDPSMGYGCLQIGDGKTNGTLVHLGIDHTLKKHEVDAPGTLIWWYSGLPLDLSRNLVRGSEFNAFCTWLNHEIETSLKELLKESPSPSVRETIQEWLMWKSEGVSEDSDTTRAAVLIQGCQSYIRAGHYREALLCAEQAVELEEDSLSWAAICLGLLGDFETAAGYYERALKLRPDDSITRANYAEDLDLAGRTEEAVEQVEFALALNPENAHALALKARFLATRSAEEALQLVDEALALP
ncbi:MAG TPA: tetratricopeptide repeat protein, partial [Phycisphaerales bacterium]|nr:tetratricopeptide repeat protein [Phycisphaerales bacterium]